ncbi:MAG: hypothetical protein K9G67_15540 [Bacteroidales bacterium]|nr:hypothetical protein [Bacteroidales bacterium]MCF8377769.1 hypothetical protein [Bacteroidales bacterium]
MDFKDIKNTWKSSFKHHETLTEEQIKKRLNLKRRSNTALYALKKNFRFEFLVGGAEYLIIIFALFSFLDVSIAMIFSVIVSIMMGIPLYSAIKAFKSIDRTIYTDTNLVNALTETIKKLRKHIKYGTKNILKYIQIPTALIIGVIMGLFVASAFNPDESFAEMVYSMETKSIVKIIVLILGGSAMMIPFSIFYFKRRFVKHFEELKTCLKELENKESV